MSQPPLPATAGDHVGSGLDPTFASDNSAGIDPRVAHALTSGIDGTAAAYGADAWSRAAARALTEQFGTSVTPYFVSTGSAANVLAIGALARPGYQVLTSSGAHAYLDEAGAVEALARCSMRVLPHDAGKVTEARLLALLEEPMDVHRARPKILSLAQATELGTVYRPEELAALCRTAHEYGLRVHLDGARLANAAATLGTTLGEISFGCGVDVVTFGTTKNGTLNAETVLVRTDVSDGAQLADDLDRFQKQLGQLHSKHRYIAAQISAILRDDGWRENALAANEAAQTLRRELESIGASISYPVEANAVFAVLDPQIVRRLRLFYLLYDGERPGEVRFMTSFATTRADIDKLVAVATGEDVVAHDDWNGH